MKDKTKCSKLKYGIVLKDGFTHLFKKMKDAEKFYKENKDNVCLYQSRNPRFCPWIIWDKNVIEHI